MKQRVAVRVVVRRAVRVVVGTCLTTVAHPSRRTHPHSPHTDDVAGPRHTHPRQAQGLAPCRLVEGGRSSLSATQGVEEQ